VSRMLVHGIVLGALFVNGEQFWTPGHYVNQTTRKTALVLASESWGIVGQCCLHQEPDGGWKKDQTSLLVGLVLCVPLHCFDNVCWLITHAGCVAAGVGRTLSRICLSVCLHCKRKADWAIITKLGTHVLYSSRSAYIDPEESVIVWFR